MAPSVDSRLHTLQPGAPGARSGRAGVERALCLLVIAIMIVAVIYAAWISIGNFSRIGV